MLSHPNETRPQGESEIIMLIKTVLSPSQAAAKIKDGMSLMVGGFMTIGSPEKIIDAIVESGVKDLTIITTIGYRNTRNAFVILQFFIFRSR